jgi:hypothetical protein
MIDLDPILLNTPADGVIELIANGEYSTKGVPHIGTFDGLPVMKSGVKLIGNAATITMLNDHSHNRTTLLGLGANEISDLNVVCSNREYPNPLPEGYGKCDGIRIMNTQNTVKPSSISKVDVVNVLGVHKQNREAFGIAMEGPGQIKDSAVYDIVGTYTSAFLMSGTGVTASNCNASFANATHPMNESFRVAYNIGGLVGGLIYKCRCHDAREAVYSDDKNTKNTRIQECVFKRVEKGLAIVCDNGSNPSSIRQISLVSLINSYISFSGKAREVMGLLLSARNTTNHIKDVMFSGNILEVDSFNPNCTYMVVNLASDKAIQGFVVGDNSEGIGAHWSWRNVNLKVSGTFNRPVQFIPS